MKNPWLTGTKYFGVEQQTFGVAERIPMVRKMTADKLREAIAWPGTGKTVRQAAESRLRRLLKEAGLKAGERE